MVYFSKKKNRQIKIFFFNFYNFPHPPILFFLLLLHTHEYSVQLHELINKSVRPSFLFPPLLGFNETMVQFRVLRKRILSVDTSQQIGRQTIIEFGVGHGRLRTIK